TAKDAFGNTATGYLGTVALSTDDDPQATFAAPYSFQPSDAGAHVLANGNSATFRTAGQHTVKATDTQTPAITGTSAVVAVARAAATHFAVAAPASTTAGAVLGATVTARDAFENTATGYAGTVRLTSTDTIADLPPDGTLSGGVGAFSVTLKRAPS